MLSWKPDIKDFDMTHAEPLGCGAISQVVKVRHKESGKFFAIKVISKMQVTQQQKVQDVMNEKQALYALSPHPFITTIFATAQSDDELYFIMEWLPHGDLKEYVTRRGPMGLMEARFVLAQITVALERVFAKGITIRDLKAENIGISQDFRIKIFDFDTCSLSGGTSEPETNGGNILPEETHGDGSTISPGEKRRYTISQIQGIKKQSLAFCGTAQYVSPEMVGQCTWSYSSDLWALGILAYFLFTGDCLFDGEGTYQVLKKITEGVNPNWVKKRICEDRNLPLVAAEFVLDLLKVDPVKRLGVNDDGKFDSRLIRSHKFFDGLEEASFWSRLDHAVKDEASTLPDENPLMSPLRPNQEDPRRSFRQYWGVKVPDHSVDYSKYVYEAPASAFDEWLLRATTTTAGSVTESNVNTEKRDDGTAVSDDAQAQEPESSVESIPASDTSSGDMEIIDDVGVGTRVGGETSTEMFVQQLQTEDGTEETTEFTFPAKDKE